MAPSRRPGVGSALGRALLLAPMVFLIVGLPENIDSWDSPSASVIPSERTMPVWGNYVLALVAAVTVVMLVAGWFLRRGEPRRRVWAAWSAGFAAAGQALWVTALAASIWVSTRPEPEDAALGTTLPDYGVDAIFAVIAVATAAVLIRDALALSRTRRERGA